MPSPIASQVINTETVDGNSSSPTEKFSSVAEMVPMCQSKGKHTLASGDSGISGTIIFQNDHLTGLYTLGGTPITGSQILTNTTSSVLFGFSPDGQWLAYSPFVPSENPDFEQFQIILLSADGQKIERKFSTKSFESNLQVGHRLLGISGLSYWINDDMIYLVLCSQNPDENTSGYIDHFPKVLDPFSGEWKNQYLNLPDRFLSDVVGISPDKSRALFRENGFSLWNYNHANRIWRDETLMAPNESLIYWSPNSSLAAYASLYDDWSKNSTAGIITRNGDFTPILSPKSPVPGMIILNISWSPDSQYLALAGKDGEDLSLFIYDVSQRKFISQCKVAKFSSTSPSLIWNPDSSRIAISQTDSPILIFDVPSGDILELAQHGWVSGWSDKFPVNWTKKK